MGRRDQINVRVATDMRDMLSAIAEFEDLTIPELLRGWCVEKFALYRKNKYFMRELEKGHLRPEKEIRKQIEEENSFSEDLGKPEEE